MNPPTDPFNMTPEEEVHYKKSVEDKTTELMSFAKLIASSREAKEKGDLGTARVMSVALSMMLAAKDRAQLMVLLTVSLGIISDLADLAMKGAAVEAADELEKMLREGKL